MALITPNLIGKGARTCSLSSILAIQRKGGLSVNLAVDKVS